MLNYRSNTLLQAVIKSDIRESLNNVKVSFEEDTSDRFVDYNVLTKVLPLRTATQYLLSTGNIVTPLVTPNVRNKHQLDLSNDVLNNVHKISGKYTLSEALVIARNLWKVLGSTFYGIVLTAGSKRLNPLHPLTAISLINQQHTDNTKWNLIVYAYADRESLDITYKTASADQSRIDGNIDAQLNCYMQHSSGHVRINSMNANTLTDSLDIKFNREIQSDDSSTHTYHMVAHQFLTEGIVAPYYGTSIVRVPYGTRESVDGINVTPMLSCNLTSSRHYSEGAEYQELEPTTVYRSVCTGSRDKRTLHGLRSLTHANLMSPHTRHIIADGALAYADSCVSRSFQLFEISTIIPKEPSDETIQPTPLDAAKAAANSAPPAAEETHNTTDQAMPITF